MQLVGIFIHVQHHVSESDVDEFHIYLCFIVTCGAAAGNGGLSDPFRLVFAAAGSCRPGAPENAEHADDSSGSAGKPAPYLAAVSLSERPAAVLGRVRIMLYSIFCTCSRIFSSSFFMDTTIWAISALQALLPRVLVSRLNSCIR